MDVGVTELVKLIVNYGIGVICLAVLIFLHLYNVRVTLPKLSEVARQDMVAFKEDLRKERQDNTTLVQALAVNFRDALEKAETASSSLIQSLIQSFREELKEERDQCHQDHEKMMAVLHEGRLQMAQLLQIIKNSGSGSRKSNS